MAMEDSSPKAAGIPTPLRTDRTFLREKWPFWRRCLSIFLWIGTPTAVLAVGAWQYSRWREPPSVEVFVVRTRPVDRILVATGRVRPEKSVTVYAKQAGQIVRLAKEEGEAVKVGDELVLMDATASQAVLEQVQAAMAAKEKELDQAGRELQRQRSLSEVNAISPELLEQAQLNVDRAQQELRRLRASANETETRVSDFTLRSPLKGVVLRRYVDPGQVVDPQSKIYEIATIGTAEVEMEVDETFGAEIRPGLPAVLSPAGSNDRWKGVVSFVSPRVDPSSGGRMVRVKVGDGALVLPPGLSVDVNIEVEKRPADVAIRRSAISGGTESPRVRVVEGGRVVERPVGFLDWPAKEVVVTQGLQAGELVLANPSAAAPGTVVRTKVVE